MKTNTLLAVCAVVAMIVALVNISVTLVKVSQVTGYATATGTVNLTILQIVEINMSNGSIEWGHGRVSSGQSNATLNTNGVDGVGTVTNGNWTTTGQLGSAPGFILDNVGNVNASLKLETDKNANDLFGSRTATHETYEWNVSQRLANSCSGGNSSLLNKFVDVNKTPDSTTFCDDFNYETNANSIIIDILLTVPADSANVSSDASAVIVSTLTATGTVTP